ncbi:hypothetical protein IWW36_003711 [Coemansia brasiliensis]|uniref:Uncharacterized protein n=1 Tax=Coemansia brasiliensis TaxID=2650707 RepID=A0A9W8IDI4_9FUNG|nr:hypothetical protein IWW36_003711 [Coemansia brasiliensis]
MSESIQDPWSVENAQLLERLALNEDVKVSWPELRGIIRQRLAQVVEQLSQSKQEEEAAPKEPETSEKRKHSEIEVDKEPGDPKGQKSLDIDAKPQDVEATEDSKEATQTPPASAAAESTSSSGLAPLATETNGYMEERARDIGDLEDRISYSLHSFDEAPFTIQRIAELLTWPERHYRNVLKFLRAVERVVYVTSTVEEFPTSMHNDEARSSKEEATSGEKSECVGGAKNGVQAHKAADDKKDTFVGGSKDEGKGDEEPIEAADKPKWDASSVPDIPPLDASDTGILHIRPTAADDKDALRSKIQGTMDPAVPVFIDEPDGTNSKVTVVPVHPEATVTEATTDESRS